MNPTTASRLLQELLERLGVPEAEPDADGISHVLFDEELSVACRSTSGAVTFESEVHVLPAEAPERERTLERLARDSAAGMRTRHSVLFLSRHGAAVKLHRRVATDGCGVRDLGDALAEFLSSLERWRETASRSGEHEGAIVSRGREGLIGLPMGMVR